MKRAKTGIWRLFAMKLSLKQNADIEKIVIKSNNSNDGREAVVDLKMSIKKEGAGKWGADFSDLAFSTMRIAEDPGDEENAIMHYTDKLRPSKRIVMEHHTILIDGNLIDDAQPKLLSIEMIDGEARVVATFRVEIPVTKEAVIHFIAKNVGKSVKVEFNPKQTILGLTINRKSEQVQVAQAV